MPWEHHSTRSPMKRRTILERMGATAAVGVGLSGTAAGSRDGEAGSRIRVDVSDVSGQVPLTELVDDPGAVFAGDGPAEAPMDADPSDVRLIVQEDTDDVVLQDIVCRVGCCCSASCPSECDSCLCNVCGSCIA